MAQGKGGVNAAGALTTLARLAVDTGGKYTEQTNELVSGMGNARGDLACVYSLGFYDDDPDEERIRNVTVRVRRPGVNVTYPAKLIHRTDAARRESQIRGGFLGHSPESDELQARVLRLRPRSDGAWDGVVAISFELFADDSPGDTLERDFGGLLYCGSRVTHEFNRHLTLARSATSLGRRVTFMEPVRIKSGLHTLSVVVVNPDTSEDHQARVEVDVPDVPNDRLFVVGPTLGRRAGDDLVLRSGELDDGGDAVGVQSSFQPLVSDRVGGSEEILALTQVCRVESKRRTGRRADEVTPMVHRELLARDGTVLGRLPEVPLALEGAGRVSCQNLLDLLPSSSLEAGEYAFRAFLVPDQGEDGGATEASFRIEPAIGSMDRELVR